MSERDQPSVGLGDPKTTAKDNTKTTAKNLTESPIKMYMDLKKGARELEAIIWKRRESKILDGINKDWQERCDMGIKYVDFLWHGIKNMEKVMIGRSEPTFNGLPALGDAQGDAQGELDFMLFGIVRCLRLMKKCIAKMKYREGFVNMGMFRLKTHLDRSEDYKRHVWREIGRLDRKLDRLTLRPVFRA